MIILKSEKEIDAIRASCRIVSETLDIIGRNLRPGVNTRKLNMIAEEFIVRNGAKPAFKGFHGYPGSICASIDEQVVHGIPGDDRIEDGQLVSIDVGVEKGGYFGDSAFTFCVGEVSREKQRVVDVTREALERGILQALDGNRLSDISWAVQHHVESNGFSVVRDLVGHGIGKQMHEEPQVPNFGKPGYGPLLKSGMTLAIEPMVNAGSAEVRTLDDNWTVVTTDGSPSAHFEHTIAITADGPVVLTEFSESMSN